ncbi:hypothetical protein STRIP9103_06156 [Streptomyces ipomoeae 91-03]|uniref:Uncharacterized protein n=1 Tax=Streptomyces ipomoeae 91-03 TaxID=698759 RepID=L1L5C7_9ACTN|nr:hypothetical protein STRIP9103_06156 [Streptomyces ipomoeae 91-03]
MTTTRTALGTAVATLPAHRPTRLPRLIGRPLRRRRERVVVRRAGGAGSTGRAGRARRTRRAWRTRGTRGTRRTGGTRCPRRSCRRRPRAVAVRGALAPSGLPGLGVLALARRRGRGAPLTQQERREAEAAVRHQECVFPLVITASMSITASVTREWRTRVSVTRVLVRRAVDQVVHAVRPAVKSGGENYLLVGHEQSLHERPAHRPRSQARSSPAPCRRYLPATPPSHGGRPVCRYRC